MSAATPQAQRPRSSESVEDGRRWLFGQPEWASLCVFVRIEPSEMDMIEVGRRVAVGYAQQIADANEKAFSRTWTVLHPAEMGRIGRPFGDPTGSDQ